MRQPGRRPDGSATEDKKYLPFALRSQDPGVLRVEATEDPRRFVLVAVGPGETCVEVEVVNEAQGCIPATVLAAPN